MKQKVAETGFLAFLLAVGVWYVMESWEYLRGDEQDFYINPGFFPAILGGLLLALIIASLVKTWVSGDGTEKFVVENFRKISLIALLTVLYIILWSSFGGLYYLWTGMLYFTVSVVLADRTVISTRRLLIRNAVIAVMLSLVIYLVFELLFSIRMT